MTQKRNDNPIHDKPDSTQVHHITEDDMNPECRLCEVDFTDTTTLQQQFLVYNRDPVLHIHKLTKPVRPYREEMTIAQKTEQTQVTLTTVAKSLEKAREQQKKPSKNRPSQHYFQIGDLVLVEKHNKEKLELKLEPGYRIVGFPTKHTARIRNKESGEPKCCNIKDLKLKDPPEDWELKAECIRRTEKFVNHPSRLPDAYLLPDVDNSFTNFPDSD